MTENKSPKIIRVTWENYDEWEDEDRLFKAWVSESAVKAWVSGLEITGAWKVVVDA